MLRLLGVIMIFCAFSWAGFSFSTSIRRKITRLETEKKLTEDISTLIRYRSLTLREIISQIAESPGYAETEFIKYASSADRYIPFAESWKSGIEKDRILSNTERDILEKMGYELGTTDAEGQMAVLNIYRNQFDEMLSAEKTKYDTKGKMYRSLGVLFGAMAGILFI